MVHCEIALSTGYGPPLLPLPAMTGNACDSNRHNVSRTPVNRGCVRSHSTVGESDMIHAKNWMYVELFYLNKYNNTEISRYI
jgi:hypothetical protein